MRKTRLENPAFTLVELLIVIAIIGVLLTLLLVGVMQARAAGARAMCCNRLRQIGLAIHAYASDQNVFPSGKSADFYLSSGYGVLDDQSLFLRVLPWLEADTGVELPSTIKEMWELRGKLGPRAVFVCPSDSRSVQRSCNFRVNYGPKPYLLGEPFKGWPGRGNGAFESKRWFRASDFPKGLSKVAAVSEKLQGDGDKSRFYHDGDFWTSVALGPPFPPRDALLELCSQASSAGLNHFSDGGSDWTKADFHYTWYNHISPPNSVVSDCAARYSGMQEDGILGGNFAARSRHSGGVNVLTMSSDVTFFSDSVDSEIWREFGNRDLQ